MIGPLTGKTAVISPNEAFADQRRVPINRYARTAPPGPIRYMIFPDCKNNPIPIVEENAIMFTWRSPRVRLITY